MNKSDYLRNLQLNAALRGVSFTAPAGHYIALYTVAETSSGGGTEVTGGGYTRVSATFAAPSGFACSNSSQVTFPVPTAIWGQVVSAAVWDAASGGNMLYFGTLATPKFVDVGAANQVFFPAGYFVVAEN